eukprot:TRINITY_DN8953_c0_g1_i1.p2 TRINITY_DN8953_c0_g1~~TRINITY_DN8953_c0_g1_i1.p2  ORF type:complete len:121 (-),score=1.37 TRINITY_DN8953_c0_g1_i1:15-377(-)
MESVLSNGMTYHKCFVFHQRLTGCLKKETFFTRMCANEYDDWFECRSKNKHRAFVSYMGSQLKKIKIYELPEYDEHNDCFYNVSEQQVRDADYYFAKHKVEEKKQFCFHIPFCSGFQQLF